MESIIRTKNLNFVYNKGKDNEFHALVNINMEIYPEEFIMFFGPSGCGKSTLLNVVAGLETPDEGSEVTVLGRDMMKLTSKQFAEYHRNDLGMVFQAYNLITSLSVLDNVALPQMFLNVGKRRREKWAMQLLERFGIDKQSKKIPTELSGGQQQRIGIARAIVNNPKIVLADEPVGNLDSVSAKNVLEILGQLNEIEKKTIIMVTHNPENLVYADRIFYLKDGTIIREVVNKDKHKEIMKQEQKTAAAEITDLMRAYHGLTPEQINILIMPYKSRIFAHHFITSRSMEETKVFEDIIQRRLMGTASGQEMFETLHRPSVDGGVGFNIHTAEKIMARINRALEMSYFVYQTHHQKKNVDGSHEKVTDDEKVEKLTTYLLHTCYDEHAKNLKPEQIVRLKKAVKDRITNAIQKNGFYTALDQPFKEEGVGLNSVTAKDVTEEIELILILGFGIVKINPQDIEGLDSEDDDQVKQAGDKTADKENALNSLQADSNIDQTEKKDGEVKEGIILTVDNYQSGNTKHNFLDGMKEGGDKGKKDTIQEENKNIVDEQVIDSKNDKTEVIFEEDTSLQDAIIAAQEREKQLKEADKTNKDNNQYF
ncbi:MAG: putative ABC transporter ATP-binding protein [Parcubacteria group bacterium ADurb.Bin316]|nr:MAG: putative ABC transporter ATP-binding protein [Parcubacteria group bacterium ADurb.Bin316]